MSMKCLAHDAVRTVVKLFFYLFAV
uniref:Uncharacterized protein n=1 Tax=Anguilla anguilla TaxID=7936 RepID=A0A0E9QLD3_ANGAN